MRRSRMVPSFHVTMVDVPARLALPSTIVTRAQIVNSRATERQGKGAPVLKKQQTQQVALLTIDKSLTKGGRDRPFD